MKVEINTREHEHFYGVRTYPLAVANSWFTGQASVVSFEPEELFGDQAHFGHEFREFTGLTPTRYVEVRRRFLREHPGNVLDSWPLPAD